ncbi:MAG: molecular chaperone GrpE [Candidatus Paceibacteria bacterium]|jgi:molecular chaperone GrpE
MVNMNNDQADTELDVTKHEDLEIDETEVVDIEENSGAKLKKMREKLARCEEEKKQILDESQRTRADFLNARKRLEEERTRDRARHQQQHIMELLPLCDSFQMAMNNTEAWEKADKAWRTGVEGISTQLLNILESYGVKAVDPQGEHFNPHRDEAIGTEDVDDKKFVDTVVTVIQRGYEMKTTDSSEIIRHARVTTGKLKE